MVAVDQVPTILTRDRGRLRLGGLHGLALALLRGGEGGSGLQLLLRIVLLAEAAQRETEVVVGRLIVRRRRDGFCEVLLGGCVVFFAVREDAHAGEGTAMGGHAGEGLFKGGTGFGVAMGVKRDLAQLEIRFGLYWKKREGLPELLSGQIRLLLHLIKAAEAVVGGGVVRFEV